jgi:uncharacterized protein (DUF1015 family)
MPLIRPFAGLRPFPRYAAEVLAPPYDVLSTAEARQRATGKAYSFLHISKAEIDLPEHTDPYSPLVYARASENLAAMLAHGVLRRDAGPCYYVYRLTMGTHQQTGLVVGASVAAYDGGRIRRHELTRPEKEDDRVRQIDALNAQTGPALLTYRHQRAVAELIGAATAAAPEFEVLADDGVVHSLWVVTDAPRVARLSALFDAMERLYIADGHHRSAAASRVAAQRRAGNPAHNGEESYNYFLAVLFPDNEMRILDYNRVVRDLNGLSPTAFLDRVQERFELAPVDGPLCPAGRGEFGMYLGGSWYRLDIRPELVPAGDPVARLEVSLLADHLIAPVLGITDPRRDHRIDFIGGIRGLSELERRVDSGQMAVAFSLFPTSMEDLMAVADSGQIMPPKSTWFEPKLADGLVSHVLD